MELNQIKNKIQDAAIEEWIYKAKKRGSVEMVTGIGKMFIFLKALYTMPKKNYTTTHLFLAETVQRKKDLDEQIKLYNEIFKVNVYMDYNLQFFTYQSAHKWMDKEFGLVGCDEIHDQLSPEYFKFHLNNKYEAIIGLSALIQNTRYYTIKRDITLREFFKKDIITKHDMLVCIAPICYKYNTTDSLINNTSRKLNIYVIKHELDKINKTVLTGGASNKFYQTEQYVYDYYNNRFNVALNLEPYENEDWIKFESRKNFQIIKASNDRSKLLYTLPSKIKATESIINFIKGKTILFNNDLGSLFKITTNIVCSKNSDEQNDSIIDRFNEDKINLIASFKKLKQGANLKGVDNAIIMSYYSSEVDIIQRIGRLRQNFDKDGNVFIFLTMNTQEVVWYDKMMVNIKDHNIIYCNNINECEQKYKEKNK